MRISDFKVQLRASHLVIKPDLASRVFKDSSTVFVSYNEVSKALLISPNTNNWFVKLHGAEECLLKEKDLKGTRSIGIRQIIIDNDLDEVDRLLGCTLNEKQNFLKIEM